MMMGFARKIVVLPVLLGLCFPHAAYAHYSHPHDFFQSPQPTVVVGESKVPDFSEETPHAADSVSFLQSDGVLSATRSVTGFPEVLTDVDGDGIQADPVLIIAEAQPEKIFLDPGKFKDALPPGSTIIYDSLERIIRIEVLGEVYQYDYRDGGRQASVTVSITDAEGQVVPVTQYVFEYDDLQAGRLEKISVYEMQRLGLEDLARGVVPAVSSSSNLKYYPPMAATDGDSRSLWMASGGEGEWIQLDFGEVKDIGRITYNTLYGPYPGVSGVWQDRFIFSVSQNGTDWTVIESPSALMEHDYLFQFHYEEPLEARYLRIHPHATSGNAYVTEIEVYEKSRWVRKDLPESEYRMIYAEEGTLLYIENARVHPPYAERVNLALGKAGKATDGLDGTEELPLEQGFLIIDLGGAAEVDIVRFDTRWTKNPPITDMHGVYWYRWPERWIESFQILGSADGYHWQTLASKSGLGRGSAQFFEFQIDPVTIRYVRVQNIRAQNHNAGFYSQDYFSDAPPYISEIAVYEKMDFPAPEVTLVSPLVTSDPAASSVEFLVGGLPVVKNLSLPLAEGRNEEVFEFTGENGSRTIFPVEIILDTQSPAVEILINGGEEFSAGPSVLVGIEATDASSGVDQMRFSIDGSVNWTEWENFSPEKFLTLDPNAEKTQVLCQVRDKAGHVAESSAEIYTSARAYLTKVNMAYFSDQTIDVYSQYPQEGLYLTGYTQPTHIAFYAQLLAHVITGDIVSDAMGPDTARARLRTLMTSLLHDQATLGYKGLLPWLNFNGQNRTRAYGIDGQRIVFGDNSNLSASLGAVSGALTDPRFSGDAVIEGIRSDIETFLDNQQVGYDFLYSAPKGMFRRGYNFVTGTWVDGNNAYQDYFGSEFRAGVLFVMLRYNYPESVFLNMDAQFRSYTTQAGELISVVAPYDGGAFQMLWPILTMPEMVNAGMRRMLEDYVDAVLDFSVKNDLPGLLSASYEVCAAGDTDPACARNGTKYAPNAGIAALAVNASGRNEQAASVYALGAAYAVKPAEVEAFLKNLIINHGDLISDHGLWEGYDVAEGQVIREQVASNVLTLLLGLAGKGPEHMTLYLQRKDADEPDPFHPGYYSRLETFYQSPEKDIVAGSFESVSWGTFGCGSNACKNGSRYIINAANGDDVHTAFKFSPGLNIMGNTLVLTYTSSRAIENVTIEFKKNVGGVPQTQFVISNLNFDATDGAQKTITIGIPPMARLSVVNEIVLNMDGPPGPLNFVLENFSLTGSGASEALSGYSKATAQPAEKPKSLSKKVGTVEYARVILEEFKRQFQLRRYQLDRRTTATLRTEYAAIEILLRRLTVRYRRADFERLMLSYSKVSKRLYGVS